MGNPTQGKRDIHCVEDTSTSCSCLRIKTVFLCPTFAQLQCTLILEARRKGKCCLSPKSHALQLFWFVSRQSMMLPPVYNFVFQPTSLYGLSHCCCRPTSLPPLMVLLCTILLLGQHVPISSRVSPYCSDSPMAKIN